MDCVYCKIIKKELPAFILYEDDLFLVILDRYPVTEGHTLIISKSHAKDIFELGADAAADVFTLAKKIAAGLKDALNCEGVNIVQNNGAAAGQSVFHFHAHVIPRRENDGVALRINSRDISIDELERSYKKLGGLNFGG